MSGNRDTPGVSGNRDIGDELAIRAGIRPEWDAVLAVYLDGCTLFPATFTARRPR